MTKYGTQREMGKFSMLVRLGHNPLKALSRACGETIGNCLPFPSGNMPEEGIELLLEEARAIPTAKPLEVDAEGYVISNSLSRLRLELCHNPVDVAYGALSALRQRSRDAQFWGSYVTPRQQREYHALYVQYGAALEAWEQRMQVEHSVDQRLREAHGASLETTVGSPNQSTQK